MKNKFFIFPNYISLLGGVAFSTLCFFSFHFLWKGAIFYSILSAIGICLFLWILVFILKKIKTVKRNFQANAVFEIGLLAIYIIVAFVSFSYFTHFFTVNDRRDAIRTKIAADIDNTKKMFDEYKVYADKRIKLYEDQLNTAINGQILNQKAYHEAGFLDNGDSNNTQKERILFMFTNDLLPTQYDSIKIYANQWLEARKSAVKSIPMGLSEVIKTIETKSNNWLNQIKQYANNTKKAENGSFEYIISFSSVEKELTQRSSPTLFSFISALILLLLLILPYLTASRDKKHPGLLKVLFKKENEENEIGRTLND